MSRPSTVLATLWHDLRDSFWSSRPFSWINTAVPFFVGSWLGGGSVMQLIIGSCYFLFPYNLLVYGVNDIFDYESDLANPRKSATSIEGAVIARSRHRRLAITITITNLPFAGYFALSGSPAARLWFGVIIVMALAYSLRGLRFKEIPLLDSFTSSTHFYSPFVYGLLWAGSRDFYLPGLIAFVIWGMASHAFGAVQDIVYDRQAGIGSVATVIGARATVWASTLAYLAAAGLIAVAYAPAGLVAASAMLLYAFNVGRYSQATDATAGRTNAGWQAFMWLNLLVGFVLSQLLILVRNPFGLTSPMLWLFGTSLIVCINLWGLLSLLWSPLVMTRRLVLLGYTDLTELALRSGSWHRLAHAWQQDCLRADELTAHDYADQAYLVVLGALGGILPYPLIVALVLNGQSAVASLLAIILILSPIALVSWTRAQDGRWILPGLLYPMSLVLQLGVIGRNLLRQR